MLNDNQVLRVQLEWFDHTGRNDAGRIIRTPYAIVFDLRTKTEGPAYGIRQRLTADQLLFYAGEHAELLEGVLGMMQDKTAYAIDRWRRTGATE